MAQEFSQPRRRVLVVDDEPSNLMLVTQLLKSEVDVRVANNGDRALALMRQEPPDLVLLDVEMPGMDGYSVCRAVKADPQLTDIPVVFLTGRASVEDETTGFETGAVDYIHKPISPPLLRARVRTHLRLKSALEEAQREKRKADELLEVVLPPKAAEELRATSTVRPRRIENVGVLFSDIVGFTAWCDRFPPEEVVRNLHVVFLEFEAIARAHGVEKLKTIGDGFMAGCGLSLPAETPLLTSVRCALEMSRRVTELVPEWRIRSGAHVGPVVAGIVGGERYQFDIWGDTVNVAARLTGAAEPGTVLVSANVWNQLEGKVAGEPGGLRHLKGKGDVEVFLVREA